IMLFVSAGLLMALAHARQVSSLFLHAPAVFIAVFVVLYLVRLTLRQWSFLILIALYLAMVLPALATGGAASITVVAPVMLCIGAVLVWIQNERDERGWARVQTLWMLLALAGWAVGVGTSFRGSCILPSDMSAIRMRVVCGTLHYSAWMCLAGLIGTVMI